MSAVATIEGPATVKNKAMPIKAPTMPTYTTGLRPIRSDNTPPAMQASTDAPLAIMRIRKDVSVGNPAVFVR
jgi:hypothetical protein